ncbi:MAG: hypothetical protein AAGF93_04110 [Cyanobacteria bacterium P01_H01_bin.105]
MSFIPHQQHSAYKLPKLKSSIALLGLSCLGIVGIALFPQKAFGETYSLYGTFQNDGVIQGTFDFDGTNVTDVNIDRTGGGFPDATFTQVNSFGGNPVGNNVIGSGSFGLRIADPDLFASEIAFALDRNLTGTSGDVAFLRTPFIPQLPSRTFKGDGTTRHYDLNSLVVTSVDNSEYLEPLAAMPFDSSQCSRYSLFGTFQNDGVLQGTFDFDGTNVTNANIERTGGRFPNSTFTTVSSMGGNPVGNNVIGSGSFGLRLLDPNLFSSEIAFALDRNLTGEAGDVAFLRTPFIPQLPSRTQKGDGSTRYRDLNSLVVMTPVSAQCQ